MINLLDKIYNSSSGVYQIRNIINNNSYIGSTNNLYRRYKEHKSKLKSKNNQNVYLQNAVNKYGLENFEFSLIAITKDYKKLEQWLIDTGKFKYNLDLIVKMPGNFNKTLRSLTDIQVKQIRWLLAQGCLNKFIAKYFNSSRTTIYEISINTRYQDIIGILECPEIENQIPKKQSYRKSKYLNDLPYIIDELNKGRLYNSIAEEFKCDRRNIRYLVKDRVEARKPFFQKS